MQLIVNYDQSPSSLPAGFVSAVSYVQNYFNATFKSPVTIEINVGYGEISGQLLDAGALGESLTFLNSVSYSSLRNALLAANAPGAGTLPSSAPPGSPATLAVSQAEGKALGLLANNVSIDGYVGFSSISNIFSYTPNATPASNQYYFVGVVEHEFTEVMGRISLLDSPGLYSAMDLYRWSGSGTRQFSTNAPSYFSINGGVTNLDNWNNFQTGNSGDLGDWAPSAGNDAFNDNGTPGVISVISSADLTVMGAIGWQSQIPQVTTAASFVAVANFNGDLNSDILLNNNAGTLQVWLMTGSGITGVANLAAPPPSWRAVGTGIFNGNTDIIWQNSDGTPAIWVMNGTNVVSGIQYQNQNPGPTWHIVGTGSFNGNTDIVWQNSDGTPAIWTMSGTNVTGGILYQNQNPGPTWHIVGTGNFNGNTDILWQNSDGTPAIWTMSGTNVTGGILYQNQNPGPTWHIVGTGNFGNGNTDIVWQNGDGTPAIWLMNGTNVSSGLLYANPGPSWHIVGVGDFNGDGKSDILWHNDDGSTAVWLMNGTQIASSSYLTNTTSIPTLSLPASDTLSSGDGIATSAPDQQFGLNPTPDAGGPLLLAQNHR